MRENIRYVVDKKLLGSAYGIITALENLGLSIGPLLVSGLHAATNYKASYFAVSLLNFFEALIGVCCGLYLLYYDYNHKQILLANSQLAGEIQRIEKIKAKKAKLEPPKIMEPAQISI